MPGAGAVRERVRQLAHVIEGDVARQGGGDETAAACAGKVHARTGFGGDELQESAHNTEVVKQEPGATSERKARGVGVEVEVGISGGSRCGNERELKLWVRVEASAGLL